MDVAFAENDKVALGAAIERAHYAPDTLWEIAGEFPGAYSPALPTSDILCLDPTRALGTDYGNIPRSL